MKRNLSERDLAVLRGRGLLSTEETAYWLDDSLIAENVFNHQQRMLDTVGSLMLETKKRVLKG
jgi:hypothetical protein